VQNLLDYEDVKFQNAAKEDLKLDGDEADAKKLEKKLRTQFKPLTKWWKKLIGEDGSLEAVRVSNRLSSTPCVVVTSKRASSLCRCVACECDSGVWQSRCSMWLNHSGSHEQAL
jgi:heat shock protein 90kDa beta